MCPRTIPSCLPQLWVVLNDRQSHIRLSDVLLAKPEIPRYPVVINNQVISHPARVWYIAAYAGPTGALDLCQGLQKSDRRAHLVRLLDGVVLAKDRL
jgi:hypothetical protein